MTTEPLSTVGIARSVASHVGTWLRNLSRAKAERKQQSLRAVNDVIAALRMTQAYTRGLQQGLRSPDTEGRIAARWTELSYELERLGLRALAKKCDIKGRYWADPTQFDPRFLAQAKTDLASVEKQARDLLVQIKLGKP